MLTTEGRGYTPGTGGDDWFSNCTATESDFPFSGHPVIGNAAVYCSARYRHSGGSVYAMMDGHVKWQKGPGDAWNTRATSGVAWRKSLAPDASVWFREN